MRTKDIAKAYNVDTREAERIASQLEPVGQWSTEKLYARKDIEALLKKEKEGA